MSVAVGADGTAFSHHGRLRNGAWDGSGAGL